MELSAITTRASKLATVAVIATAIGAMAMPLLPVPALATADKVVTSGASTYGPGDTVNLEVRVKKAPIANTGPFEVVFVVDASLSMGAAIDDAKTPMKAFADSLADVPGSAKVSIVSFGYNNTGGDSNQWFPKIIFPLRQISTSSDIASLKSAVDSIAASPDNAYSDLQRGMQLGNDQFGTGSSNGRFLVMLTDGLHNFPAAGSFNPISSSWDGKCTFVGGPTSKVPGTLNITSRKFDRMILIPGGSFGNLVDGTFVEASKAYYSPCGYQKFAADVPTGSGFIDYIVQAGTNSGVASSRETNMATAVDAIKKTIPTYIVLTDQLNTAVFGSGSITSTGSVVNCSNGDTIPGASSLILGDGDTFRSYIPYNDVITQYCISLTAKVGSGATPGTKSINMSVSPDDRVKYYNIFFEQIASDNISLGSINIAPAEKDNLKLSNFFLSTAAGKKAQRVFISANNLYLNVRLDNTTSHDMQAGAVTQFYKNQSSVNLGQVSDIPLRLDHGGFWANGGYTWQSWPGGSLNGQFIGTNNYWKMPAGDYRAWAYANYKQDTGPIEESSYTDNKQYVDYSVIDHPTNLSENTTCDSATLTWSAGSSNITGYILSISPNHGTLASRSARSLSARYTGLQPNTTYTWEIQSNTKNGIAPQYSPTHTFTTPACPDLAITSFRTTDNAGTTKYVFNRNEDIFVNTVAANLSSGETMSAIQTQIYANKPNTVAVNTMSDTTPNGMYIQHGLFGPNTSYEYGSYPGGHFNGAYNGQKSWREASRTGVLTSRAYIDYNATQPDSNTSNNQGTFKYAVIVPPTLIAPVIKCDSFSLRWNAGTGVGRYRVVVTNTTTGTSMPPYTVTGTSINDISVGEGPEDFTWYLEPQVNVGGTWRSGERINGSSFSTPPCPHFDLFTSNPTTINPGSVDGGIAPITIQYLPSDSFWNPATDNITLAIRRFEPGAFDCENNASLPAKGAADDGTTDSGQVTARFSGGSNTQVTVPALTKNLSLTAKADPTATLGTYTLCIGAWSNHATDEKKLSVVIHVDMAAWLQVAGPRAGTQGAGDVHSNGTIGNMVIPSNPLQRYFFLTNSTGVVSSGSSIGINPSSRITSLFSGWASRNYPSTNVIKTPEYAGMVQDLERKGDEESLSNNARLLHNNSCNSGQSKNFHVAGNASLDEGTTITFPSGCDGVQYNFFVDGNLYVHSNVVDETQRGTLVFIVNGDIVLDSDISRIDGVYMFGGRFMNGSSATQLVVNGSLLGLAGTSPSAGTGSFVQSGGVTGLQRDLGADDNATTPAEIIYYQPKYLYLLKDSVISGSIFSWTE